jgi:hypothetical protein
MLTARSVLVITVSLAVLALVGGLISLLQPPDRGGLGRDTYGTKAEGYRALFDTLTELKFDQRRELAPPNAADLAGATLVLWSPDPDLVQIEPVYLARLRQWIRSGGRVVVAPQAVRENDRESSRPMELVPPTTVLRELGLSEIETTFIDLPESGSNQNAGAPNSKNVFRSAGNDSDSDSVKSEFERYLFPTLFPTTTVKVAGHGSLATPAANVAQLEVPTRLQVLDLSLSKPDGKITVELERHDSDQSAKPPVLAAQFKLGAGEIVVVGDPAIFDNRLFSQADNAVLAVNLLGEPQQTIVWDEFYHGLTVRGNPMYLLTRANYAVLAGIVVALTAVWVWRRGIFLGPPLADLGEVRRTQAEYIEAMANFLHRGAGSLAFMLAELRRGVLWSLRRDFGSQRDRETTEEVVAAVARRDPPRAQRLLDAVTKADLMLSQSKLSKPRDYLSAAKELLDCL